jgi:hypothetical protein
MKDFLRLSSGMQDDLLTFLSAPHGDSNLRINRIFLEARTYSDRKTALEVGDLRTINYDPLTDPHDRQHRLRQFLKRAHKQGVAVEYLDGYALWVTDPDSDGRFEERGEQVCRDVVAFNKTSIHFNERFDGINFDIEPHKLTGWRSGDEQGGDDSNLYNLDWIKQWMRILRSCRQTLDSYASETGHQMTLSTAVGDNYHHFVDRLVDRLNAPDTPIDYLTVMNYLDGGINTDGKNFFEHGYNVGGSKFAAGVEPNLLDWTNVPLLFGMETIPVSDIDEQDFVNEADVTFRDDGLTDLHDMIDSVFTDYTGTNTLGVAIHHYYKCGYSDFNSTSFECE